MNVVAPPVLALLAIGGLTLALTRREPEDPRLVLAGNHAFTTGEVLAGIATPEPDDTDAIGRAALMVSAFYWDHGYADIDVGTPSVDGAAITIPVVEGPKFTIGKVALHGDVLGTASLVQTHPGMTFSRTAIAADREALNRYYVARGYAYANVIPRTSIANTTIDVSFEIDASK